VPILVVLLVGWKGVGGGGVGTAGLAWAGVCRPGREQHGTLPARGAPAAALPLMLRVGDGEGRGAYAAAQPQMADPQAVALTTNLGKRILDCVIGLTPHSSDGENGLSVAAEKLIAPGETGPIAVQGWLW